MNGRHAVAICHRGSAYSNSNSSQRHVVRDEGRLKHLHLHKGRVKLSAEECLTMTMESSC